MMRTLLLACLLIAVPTAAALATPLEKCDSCTSTPEVKLCSTHYQNEQSTITRLEPELSSGDVERVTEALKEVAALTSTHENAPSTSVAECLAAHLDDGQAEVRALAARLLGQGQHEQTALDALLPSLRGVEKEMEEALKGVEEFDLDRFTGPKKGGEEDPHDPDGLIRQAGGMAVALEQLRILTERVEAAASVLAGFVDGLENLRDERATAALAKLCKEESGAYENERVVGALLGHGSRDALQAVVASLKVREKDIKDRRKAIAKLERSKAPRPPKSWEGTKKQWEASYARSLSTRIAKQNKNAAAAEARLGRIHDALSAFAHERNLAAAKVSKNKVHAAWRRWAGTHGKSLPKSLGRIDAPADGS